MKKYLKWLWVPVFGIVSVLLFIFTILIVGPDGLGSAIPLFITASPLAELMMLGEGFGVFVFLVPFYWMGEAVLALCRNKYCKWAFWVGVPGKYIYTLILIFTLNTRYPQFPGSHTGIDLLLIVVISYIGMQLLLWALFLHTWGRIRFVHGTPEPPSF